MPIEFRCTQCHKLLRTQDDTAGKQAKCPLCGTLVQIPELGSPPPLPLGAAPPAAGQFVAGAASSGGTPADRSSSTEPAGVSAPLEIMGVQSIAWRILWQNLARCIGAALIAAIVYCAATWCVNAAFGQVRGQKEAVAFSARTTGGSWLVEFLIYSLLAAGQANFFLKIARGQPAAISDVFSGWRWALNAFLVCFLTPVAAGIGLILLVVPGIIVLIMFSQGIYLVVDRNAGVGEALQTSIRLTHGHKLKLFGLFVIVGLFALFTTLFTCGLAIIVLLPWIGILRAVVYLKLSGEPVIADADV
jgi:hypothetical protein